MTTVARQITVMSSLRMTPSPPSPQGLQSRGGDGTGGGGVGVQSYILSRSKDPPNASAVMARAEQKSSKVTKTVRIAEKVDSSHPPPPPPTRTTSSLQRSHVQFQSSNNSVDSDRFSQSLNMSSAGEVVTMEMSASEGAYVRQRSNSNTVGVAATPQSSRETNGDEDERRLNTHQNRRLNPNAPPTTHSNSTTSSATTPTTGAGGRGGGVASTAGKKMLSRSQPQLHRIDQQATAIVKPNDRIKKNMFDEEDTDDEKEGSWSKDYGSGYIPTLMKISHGEIQKHAVAVTTPIVPPTSSAGRRNLAGSDPNLLDTSSHFSGSSTTTTTSDPIRFTQAEDQQERKSESPTSSRERSSSLVSSTASSNEATTIQTTPIARAYREYLMEKMDKERQAMRFSPGKEASSNAMAAQQPLIPPPPQFQQQEELQDTLSSSEIKQISPAQLQSIDMPDRACLPKILPPTATDSSHAASTVNAVESKQEKWAGTLDNGGYPSNPFLAHSSLPRAVNRAPLPSSQSYHTGFSYGTLPRSGRPSLPESSQPLQQQQQQQQQQGVVQTHMLGQKGKAQSVNDLRHRPGAGGDFPDSTVEHMSGYMHSSQRHMTTDNLPAYHHTHEVAETSNVGGWSQHYTHYSTGSSSPLTSMSNSSSQSSSTSSPGFQTANKNFDSNTDFRHSNLTQQQGVSQAVSMTTANPSLSTTPAGIGRKAKPPVLPKPASRKNGNATNLPSVGVQEKSNFDPLQKYGQAGLQPNNQHHQQKPQSSPSPSPMPLTPFPTTVSSFDAETMQLRQPPYNQSVQYGRSQKQRLYPGVIQQSTNLLEIEEADEIEEQELRRMSTTEVQLSDYVSLNSSLLPKRVRISKGFCSDSTEVTMSQGEEFDLHFLTELKSALVTGPSGVPYSVPLNSSVRISIVYDPFDVEKVALSGFHFQTAGVIMGLKSPPVIVAAMHTFDGGSAESSVGEGEILIVEAVRNSFHGRLLKVFSLRHGAVKFLDEHCSGGFTTNPEMIKMSLSEVYECSIPLPQKVVLTPAGTIPSPSTQQPNLPVLRQFMMAKSVVATPTTTSSVFEASDPLPNGESNAISISLDLDVKVTEVTLGENQMEKLCKRTQNLFAAFDRIKVTPYVDMPTSSSYAAQCALFSSPDPKKLDKYGLEIIHPNCITPLPKKKPRNTSRNDVTHGQIPQSGFDGRKMESRLQIMEGKYEKLETKVTEMGKQVQQVASKVDQIHTYLRKAQDTMTKHKKMLQEEASEEQRKKKVALSSAPTSSSSTTSSASTLPRSSLGSLSSSEQQLQPLHRSVSRSHSDDITRAASDGTPTAKSTTTTISTTHRTSYAKAESIDIGSLDQDETFTMRSRSSSTGKPPVMPKPKNLKRGANNTIMQKLKAIKVTGKGKSSIKKDERAASKSPVPTPAAQMTESEREEVLIQSLPSNLRESLNLTSTEAIDLKEFLIETDTLSKPTPKPRPKKSTQQETTPTTATITTPTTTTPSNRSPPSPRSTDVLEADIDKLASIGDDLTDWCLQVEDELTQLYNESILSTT